jgi:hypothetical protein
MIRGKIPDQVSVLREASTWRLGTTHTARAVTQAAEVYVTPQGTPDNRMHCVTQSAEATVIVTASVYNNILPVLTQNLAFVGLRVTIPEQNLPAAYQEVAATVKTVASIPDDLKPVEQAAAAKVSPAPVSPSNSLAKLRQYVDATTWPETGDLSAEEVGPVEQTVVGWSGWKYSLYLWPTDAVRQRVDAVVSPSMSPVGTPIGPVTQSAAATVTYKIGSNELRALSSKRTYATVVNPVEVTISQRLAPAENWAPISHNPGRLAIVRQTLPALRQSIRTNIIYRTIQIPVTRSASSDRVIIVIAQDTVLCETVSVAESLVRVHI